MPRNSLSRNRLPRNSLTRTPARYAALLLATALTLTACGTNSDDDAATNTEAGGTTLENCGEEVTVEAPPERVVSLNQGSTEILLSLGLADKVVGTATWTDPILDELAADNESIPRLAENAPSFEVVLEQEPDFVTASFTNTLGEGGVAAREQFTELGVGTYISPSDCEGKVANDGDGARETPFTPELVYKEIRELAEIFDVTERGEELVADLEQRMETVSQEHDFAGTSAMFWFANSESPYMAGCCGSPGVISDALGLENVFDDTNAEWPQINWEVVAARNPDVIVLGDLTRESQTAETADAKIEFLESHPVTSEMTAVREQRYISLSGAEMNPSIRTIYGTEHVAEELARMDLHPGE